MENSLIEEQYKLAVKADPNDLYAHSKYGYFLEKRDRLEEAEEQYKLAVKADPNYAYAHSIYGSFLEKRNRLEEAEEQYKLAVKADPNDAYVHSIYGSLLEKRDRLEEAEEQYKLAVKADPNYAYAHSIYGSFLEKRDRLEEAEEQYKLAVKADPNYAHAHSIYGSFLEKRDRLEEAEEQYKLAVKADPNYVYAYLNYGDLLKKRNRLEEAEEQYKIAVKADPNYAYVHSIYGSFLEKRDRLEEAEEQYKLAVKADPNDAYVHSKYGDFLEKRDRLEEAEEQYKLAVKADPNYVYAYLNYGDLLKKRNRLEEAEEQYKIASRLYGKNGNRVREHLCLSWLYEEFANKYYNSKDYKQSGKYAEISGEEYIEAGKQAGENFKNTYLTKGYTLKGRAKIRKLELQPPYEIEKFKEIMSGIYEASKWYKKAAEISPKDNQICNACSTSMLCLSEMLDYMLAVIKQKNIPRLEDETEKWKKQLAVSEQIYKGSKKGEAFVQSLYKLMACIENLDKYKKFAMWKEDNAFGECVEELKEIAGNIEGPLQKIIEDSAAQMDFCRGKIKSYVGTETGGVFEPEIPVINSIDTPVESKQEDLKRSDESKKGNKIVNWIVHHPLKSLGSFIFAIILNHYSEALFSQIQKFVITLLSYI